MITRAPTRPCRDSVVPTQGYGLSEWRESLKEILLYAGIKNQPAVFLFSDTQIVFEAMLEDINNVLNTASDSALKLNLNLNHMMFHAGRRPEPLRARGRRDHHDGLQAGLPAEAAPADQTEYFCVLSGARHGESTPHTLFFTSGRSLQK